MDTTHTSVAAGQEQAPPATTLRLGPAHLTVTDLERSIAFYERSIGLQVRIRAAATATLWAEGSDDLLVLAAEPAARRAGRHAGLYHVALLHPSRLELARAAARLADTRTPIIGASDHGISEAIYLPDPDGNGIELAADRERAQWPDLGDITSVGPRPLDLPGLRSLTAREEPLEHASDGLTVGHLHLHVGSVDEAVRFYCDVVGFDVMTRAPSAAFVAAGGYHHHLGLNTWRGEGVPPAPPGTVGLRRWEIVLDAASARALRERLEAAGGPVEEHPEGFLTRDPWGHALLVRAS
jgi:catechol 2,3-dioxygenase